MATTLHTPEEIHARVMHYAVCDSSMVLVEEVPMEMRVVVKLPLNKLLLEPDELKSVIAAGLPVSTAVDVEALT